jgi:hypothetical protein
VKLQPLFGSICRARIVFVSCQARDLLCKRAIPVANTQRHLVRPILSVAPHRAAAFPLVERLPRGYC